PSAQKLLTEMSKSELIEECKKLGVKKVGNIKELITRIEKHQGTTLDAKEKMLKEFASFNSNNKKSVNQFYKENFNLVDRIDKLWNEADYHIRMEQWKAKFFWGVFKQYCLNAFALFREYEKIDWVDFRVLISEHLIKQGIE